MEHFTRLSDVKKPKKLLKSALKLKKDPLAHKKLGKNKTILLLFFNPSLRTRISSEKAALNLGMSCIVYDASQGWKLEFEQGAVMNADRAEHIREAAGVISQYADVIGIRTFPSLTDREKDYADAVLYQFQEYASVPIVSLESATRHPLQSLADWITIEEFRKKKKKPKVVLSWAPHPKALPQAVSNSFLEWMKVADVDLMVTNPEGYDLSPEFTAGLPIEHDQRKAFDGADFIYTKNWSSYEVYGQRLNVEKDWTITPEKMKLTNKAYFMHCLPVRRNVVVADQVINSKRSLVLHQANNRTYAAQAVLQEILKSL
jgi:N-succinyl-L-ornithine transcarbamylase